MTRTLRATFDGHVLLPDEPLALPPNTRVLITVISDSHEGEKAGFLDVAEGLRLEGPADWSERLDEYLYGGRGETDV